MTRFQSGRHPKPRTFAYRAVTAAGRRRGIPRSIIRRAMHMQRIGRMAVPRG